MNRLETLFTVLLKPFQRFENACIQLLTQRGVDVAAGVQLDVLGKIVGQARLGNTDDVYRRYIRARIATNRSTGRREEIINIAHLIVNLPGLVVRVHTIGNASAIVQLDGVAIDQATADVARDMICRAAAANGVRLVLEYALVPPASVFRYDSGPGFDVGHYAGAEE